MREMRDSGVPWIGEVPAGWEVQRLGRIVRLVSARGAYEKSIPYIALENIESWSGKVSVVAEPKEIESTISFCEVGDVLFGKLRPYLAKVVQVKTSCACSSELLVLRPTRVEGRYLFYLLINKRFIDVAESVSYGAKMPRASWGDLRYVPLPLPPLTEQRRIAGWLDERCASIDAAVEAARASIDEYEAYKKSVISHAVTRGLDPDAPLKDTGIRWIGAIPDHWETVPIKAVTKRRSGHTPDRKIPEYWDGDIVWVSLADSPYLRKHRYISESKNHITPAGIEHSSAEILPSGCVLLSRDATVGLCAITKTELAVSQHFMAYECGPAIYNEYLLDVFYAMNDELIGMSMGSTIPTIGLSLIRKLVTPLPPLPEQRAIADYLDSRTAAIDAVVAQKRAIVEDLLAYKKSLIYEAVTGKREV